MRKQKKIGKEYYEAINRIKEMKRKLKDEIQNSKEVFIKYNGGF